MTDLERVGKEDEGEREGEGGREGGREKTKSSLQSATYNLNTSQLTKFQFRNLFLSRLTSFFEEGEQALLECRLEELPPFRGLVSLGVGGGEE